MSGRDTIVCSQSEEQTRAFGDKLGRSLAGGEVIALSGQLGAGKTQLVKGIARGNRLTDANEVTSPTFTLVQEYDGRLKLYHIDCYRLNHAAEFAALGVEEMITDASAVVIEWADKVADALPEDRLAISIDVTGERDRRMAVRSNGPRSARLMAGTRGG